MSSSTHSYTHSYEWRGQRRHVLIVRSAAAVDRALEEIWPRIGAVTLDCEFLREPRSNEPAIVSLSFGPHLALIWHRPNPDHSRQIPAKLAQLLTSPKCPKIGFSIHVWTRSTRFRGFT